MSIITSHHLSKDSFLIACKICEQGNPSITHKRVDHGGHSTQNLLKLNAFIAGRKDWTECKDSKYREIVYRNEQAGYLNDDGEFIEIPQSEVYTYKLDLNWMIKVVAKNLELPALYPSEVILEEIFWRIGTLKLKPEVPIFFARKTELKSNFEKIREALQDRIGINKGIILTTSPYSLPSVYQLPGDHKLISLHNCLVHDNTNFHIDRNILKAAIGVDEKEEIKKSGFSSGYRAAYFNNIHYTFTRKQAEVIEVLYSRKTRIHKHELLAEVDSSEDDVYRIFRNRKKEYHPAWNVLIKNDGKGYYWLEY